ncbi:hypothetical protein MUG78_17210 [Gordonia alkaliphila]|uniref:hypothetical protein n=1 Tax=Gordonia alkaliphila TaxID=1053547 RepID=UPI001FF1A6A7|nr:hypothetical protein [Gordonia alkaliphila]MCK0441141.1 hypothetical protein [Gordonia alkaliphila]
MVATAGSVVWIRTPLGVDTATVMAERRRARSGIAVVATAGGEVFEYVPDIHQDQVYRLFMVINDGKQFLAYPIRRS